MNTKILQFKWTASRGQDTYGYNICTLYADGKKASSCKGGGYDMEGTAFGGWIEKEFQAQLVELVKKHKIAKQLFYGLIFNNKTVCLDGGCGFCSMQKILNALGYNARYISETKKERTYILEEYKPL